MSFAPWHNISVSVSLFLGAGESAIFVLFSVLMSGVSVSSKNLEYAA